MILVSRMIDGNIFHFLCREVHGIWSIMCAAKKDVGDPPRKRTSNKTTVVLDDFRTDVFAALTQGVSARGHRPTNGEGT